MTSPSSSDQRYKCRACDLVMGGADVYGVGWHKRDGKECGPVDLRFMPSPSEKDGESTASRCPSCGQQMRGTDWVDRLLADNARLKLELTQACLERNSARNVLARAIELERLANMRADQANGELDAAKRELAIANLKNASSLANNLCPDHRDKQKGKPCLACEIERLQKAALSARQEMPSADEIKLACGEMTAQELRTAKAVLGWFIRRADNRKAQEGKDG